MLAAYVAFAIAPGPRRFDSGLSWPIVIAVVAFAVGVGTLRPRRVVYAAGVSAILLALVVAASGRNSEFLGGWTFAMTLAIGCIALGASVWTWIAALGTYLALGGWALLLLLIREGPTYLPDQPTDIDALFWTVIFPVTLWPELTFGMLGAFGIVYH